MSCINVSASRVGEELNVKASRLGGINVSTHKIESEVKVSASLVCDVSTGEWLNIGIERIGINTIGRNYGNKQV